MPSTSTPSTDDSTRPATRRPAPPGPAASFVRGNAVTLVAGAVAAVLAAVIWFGLPHDREVSSAWLLLFKLSPFVAASIGVAWLDVDWARRLRLHLFALPVCFLIFFCYFVPKLFFYSDDFGPLYYHMLTLVPFIILTMVLAYRLGGGSRSGVLRVSFALLLLQLSGLEDLAYITVNDHPPGSKYASIPEVWDWASHMTVFLGHPPSKNEAFAFIAVHVLLALLVLFLPGRIVASLVRRLRKA
jgi:hypothetical protein